MYQSAFGILTLTVLAWGLVGKATGDWQLALYTGGSVFVFGSILFYMMFRRSIRIRMPAKKTAPSPEVPLLVQTLKAQTKELENLKNDFTTDVVRELRAPLTELQRSARLLLDGTYGNMSPAAEEALRQLAERAEQALRAAETFIAAHPITPTAPEPAKEAPSIKRLKIS